MENQEEKLKHFNIYSKSIIFKNESFQCDIKVEESKYSFLLYSNDKIFEKIMEKDESQKAIFQLMIDNPNGIMVIIKNISEKQAELEVQISSSMNFYFIIYLEKVEKEKSIIKKKSILEYDINDLIYKCENKNNYKQFFIDYPCVYLKNCYGFLIDNNKRYLIFTSFITVNILKDNKRIGQTKIRTNYEIKSFLSDEKVDIKDIYVGENKLTEIIDILCLYIIDNKLNLILKQKEKAEVKFGIQVLNSEKDYTPEEYSKYFFEYFQIESTKNTIFLFEKNKDREKIYSNVIKLFCIINIKKYLITGPYACGKSLTLFRISRIMENIIYINIKTLKHNEDDKDKCLRIMLSEFERINIDINNFNKKFEDFNFNKNVFSQLLDLLEIILELFEDTIILILDQFKPDYFPNVEVFMNKIEDLIKNKKLKLVQCSSINDNKMRDLLIPTWEKFSSNPEELDSTNQNYYFYYFNLYNPKYTLFSQQLFGNRYKYMKILKKESSWSDRLNEITNKIVEKIKKFKKYELEKHNNSDFFDYNLNDILLFLHKNINKELNKSKLLQTVSICPLKFFIVDIQSESFIIKPLFPFLQYCLSKYIENSDCEDYFQKGRYKYSSFLTNSVKGEYFEFAVKKAITDYNIINIKEKKNFVTVKVNEICKMDEIINDPYQEIIKKLEEESRENQNKEIIEVEREEDLKKRKDLILIKKEFIKNNNNVKSNIENLIKTRFQKYYSFTQNLDDDLNKYQNVINGIELGCLKNINDFKKDEILLRIQNKKKILFESIKKKNQIKKNFYTINISDIKNNSKFHFTGKESIFIDQSNHYGKMVDYGVLLGEENNKIFIGFQMKCYSEETTLNDRFITKVYIKESLQKILLNSKELFNCDIKSWYYYLIFYYNDDDEIANQIGYAPQFQCLSSNIAYLLYNPKKKQFLSSNHKIVKQLNFTNEANLDYENYLNIKPNYEITSIKYDSDVDNVNSEEYRNIYFNDFFQFIRDFNKYGKTAEKILDNLSKLLQTKKLYYCKSCTYKNVILPNLNKLFLFPKKSKPYYISVIRTKNKFEIYDFETKNNYNFDENLLISIIDVQKKYYILTTTESIHPKNTFEYLKESIEKQLLQNDYEKNLKTRFNSSLE